MGGPQLGRHRGDQFLGRGGFVVPIPSCPSQEHALEVVDVFVLAGGLDTGLPADACSMLRKMPVSTRLNPAIILAMRTESPSRAILRTWRICSSERCSDR